MKRPIVPSLAVCAALAIALTACNRAESPSQVAADVAEAQADRSEAIADARMQEAETLSDTATAAASRDMDDRGDAIEDRAEARYDTAIAEARGDFEVARQGCESLSGSAQADCTNSAEAA